jgi:hypothetical protein
MRRAGAATASAILAVGLLAAAPVPAFGGGPSPKVTSSVSNSHSESLYCVWKWSGSGLMPNEHYAAWIYTGTVTDAATSGTAAVWQIDGYADSRGRYAGSQEFWPQDWTVKGTKLSTLILHGGSELVTDAYTRLTSRCTRS